MKRICCLLSAVLVGVFMLVSCQKSSNGNGDNFSEKNQNEHCVSDEQIIKDLTEESEFQTCYTSKYVYESKYEITQLKIEKRQTNIDEKEDIIYCTVFAQNKYFWVVLDVKLIYNFYDVGGWILDEIDDLSVINVKAESAPELDLVYSEIITLDYGNSKLSYVLYNNDGEEIYTDELRHYVSADYIEYIELSEDMFADACMQFDTITLTNAYIWFALETENARIAENYCELILTEQGWDFVRSEFSHKILCTGFVSSLTMKKDISGAIGKFYAFSMPEFGYYYHVPCLFKMDLIDIDMKNLKAYVRYSRYSDIYDEYGDKELDVGEIENIFFNPFTMSFNNYTYDFERNCWGDYLSEEDTIELGYTPY